jgi:hypothetical protein
MRLMVKWVQLKDGEFDDNVAPNTERRQSEPIAQTSRPSERRASKRRSSRRISMNWQGNSTESELHTDTGHSSVQRATSSVSKSVHMRVAALVTALCIIVPYLTYTPADKSVGAWTSTLKYLARSSAENSALLPRFFQKMHQFYRRKDSQLMSISINGPFHPMSLNSTFTTSHSLVRQENIATYQSPYQSGGITYQLMLWFDETRVAQWKSGFFLILVTGALLSVIVFALSFGRLLEKHVTQPLSKLILSLKSSARTMVKNMRTMSKHLVKDEPDLESDNEREGTVLVHQLSDSKDIAPTFVLAGDEEDDLEDDDEEEVAEAEDLAKMVEKCKTHYSVPSALLT